jgi:hypothetical protein
MGRITMAEGDAHSRARGTDKGLTDTSSSALTLALTCFSLTYASRRRETEPSYCKVKSVDRFAS